MSRSKKSILLTKDLTINKQNEIANNIIDRWQYDDSADILAEDICCSCKENNSNNVSISFAFTNYCPNFKQQGLIIYWKTN